MSRNLSERERRALLRSRLLMYHAIDDACDDPNTLGTSPRRFREQMGHLASSGIRGVSMAELLEAVRRGEERGLVGLTFDDGYRDFRERAVPILKEFGFTATVFVLAGMFGGTNSWKHHVSPHVERRLMDREDVVRVSEAGMEVGSHFMYHAVLPDLALEELRRGLRESREVLSEIVGSEVQGFCYPYGLLNHEVVREVREAGYCYGCSVVEHADGDEFDLPRVPLWDGDNLARLIIKRRFYFTYRRIKELLRPGAPGDERLR